MADKILDFVEFKKDDTEGVDGLANANSVTVSPDGKFLYVSGYSDSAVEVFARDAQTGKLTFVEVQQDGINSVDGLANPTFVTVSPDGKFLYASGYFNSAVVVFMRDTSTGKLTFVEVQKDDTPGIDGLSGVSSVTVSPDNKFLYATGVDDSAVAVFALDDTTGKLTFVEVQQDGVGVVDGLAGAESVTVSPDGKFLYAAGYEDSAVAVFVRDATTGKLIFVEVQKDGVGVVDGLDGVNSLIVSPDGKFLYAAGYNDSAVAVFARDATTGQLTFVEVQKDGVGVVDGLDGAESVTVSPDGKFLYAAGVDESAVAVFARNAETGKLSFLKVQKDGVGVVDGLAGAYSVTVSPDSKFVYAAGYDDSAVVVFDSSPNNAPVLVKEIADQGVTEDSVFNFKVPDDTFTDADVEDILTYTATLENDDLLPTWLNFDTASKTFIGTPSGEDVGSLNIKVTAQDSTGAKVSDVFTLAIADGTALLTKITGDIFTVKTKLNIKGDKGKLSIKIKTSTSKEVNELGVFFVDDEQGKINGIAPGAEGYTLAALSRSQVISYVLGNLPNGFNTADLTNILEFDSDTKLRFYEVSKGSREDVLSGKTSLSNVLFSSNNNAEDGGFSLNFQDFVVNVQSTDQALPLGTSLQGEDEGELIDLRGVTQSITAKVTVNREASFNNYVGFYEIADASGGIDTNGDGTADILIGQAGYTQAAVRQRVAGIDLTVDNQGTATYTGSFDQADSVFAPFIIVDGRADAILDGNANNDPSVYFTFLGANSDKTDHIRLLANNTFGFEDLANGGDKDYNDVIIRIDLSVNAA
ncbi:beta-propeller fold lactonase family protein [Nostoc sp.]|uniref:beta-propeller fold lactonase family protein n=1 Tax=Nostoc sp. TaxID=1180 RepID=UPI003593D4AF